MTGKGDHSVLLLLSGGIDSTACLNFFREQGREVRALFIEYGQPAASKEEEAATAISLHYDTPLTILRCRGLGRIGKGFVLGRNAFFAHAALMTFDNHAGLIAMGIHAGTTYADCTEHFLTIIQSSLDLYADGRIVISAPFIRWDKRMIWDYCRAANVPLQLTYSCELGKDQPCGKCLSCKDLEALYACED